MCNKIIYHHLCSHITPGPLITCGVPTSILHHTNRLQTSSLTLCLACSFTVLACPIMHPSISQAMTSRLHPGSPFSPFVTPLQSRSTFASARSINGVLKPGTLAPSVTREVRFEMIRRKLEADEHFKAEDIGIGTSGRRDIISFTDETKVLSSLD